MAIGEFYGIKIGIYQKVSIRIWGGEGGEGLLCNSLKEYPDMAQNGLVICTSFVPYLRLV